MSGFWKNFRGFRVNLTVFIFLMFFGTGNGARKFPSLRRTIYMEPTKQTPGPEKEFAGIRVRTDSILILYYHEQTIAVVEVSHDRELFNCELLEVKTNEDKRVALSNLKPIVSMQTRISFPDMKDLMSQCQKLDPPINMDKRFVNVALSQRMPINHKEFASIFSGVFPGTKWCGAGDIAGSYHDLGTDKNLDKCCRTHDLCPVKVAGLKTQYNITNYAIYTKSHCDCDEMFYNCLKAVGSTVSNVVGTLYFNVGQISCIEDISPSEPTSKPTKKRLVSKSMRY